MRMLAAAEMPRSLIIGGISETRLPCANILIREHGEDVGGAVWQRVMGAVEELLQDKAGEGETVH